MEFAKNIKEKITNLFSSEDQSTTTSPPNPDDVLDICFLLDITGSMGNHIKMMGECLNDLVYYFSSTFAPQKVYMSFVGYRDFGDNPQFVIEDFSNIDMKNVLQSSLYNKIKEIEVSGGGDYPEDIRGAIKKALKLKWRSVNKFIVLIADAPTHGTRYCDQGDDYPKEDIQDAIEELIKRKIGFLGVEFASGTDKMYKELAEIFKSQGMSLYYALEDMKKLYDENKDQEERVKRFMDLVATKIKETMYQIIRFNKKEQIAADISSL